MLKGLESRNLIDHGLCIGIDIETYVNRDLVQSFDEGLFLIECIKHGVKIDQYIDEEKQVIELGKNKDLFEDIIQNDLYLENFYWRNHSTEELSYLIECLKNGQSEKIKFYKEYDLSLQEINIYERLQKLYPDDTYKKELLLSKKYPIAILYKLFNNQIGKEEADRLVSQYKKTP